MQQRLLQTLRKQLEEAKEEADNLEKTGSLFTAETDSCNADIIDFTLKIFDYKCLSMALSYVKAVYNQQPPEEEEEQEGEE
ncbi:MAG: hypothetical protein ACLRIP_12525 [Blautia massiliensis (ex Durand et al. 2017)]